MSFENFKNESGGADVEASIAALEKEKRAEMSKLQDKFEKSDTEKRTKVAQEIVDLENSYNKEIEALRGGKMVASGKKEEAKEIKETTENKKELNSAEFSLFDKAEAGLLISPKVIKEEIEKLKQEIKADEKKFISDDRIVSEKELIAKENKIRKLEIVLIDTENKIKNDYEKKGPENVILIMAQEEKILSFLRDLGKDDLSLVPKTRALIHQWNVADAQDYFANEQKIKEALTIVSQTEKLGEKSLDSVNSLDDKVENLNSVGDVEEALQFNDDLSKNKKETESSNQTSFSDPEAVKKDKVDLSMFDDMQKIAYFNEPSTKKENISSDQEMENNVFQEELEDEILETEQNEGSQEKEDKKKRAGIFERIRRNKKLKWLVMALGLTAIGFGIFKGIDKKDDKKKDNTENKINTNDREEINPDDTIVLTPDDFANEHNEILKGLNPDVIDTINEEVGAISKIVTLEKGDGVGLINDYKMHNSYKVNFIDGETGAIHRDLAAISRTVQPNDLVIENVNGEIFVVCFHGIHDSGKTGYEGLADNNIEPVSEADDSVALDNNIEQANPQVGPEVAVSDSTSKNNLEIKNNITPKDSSESEIVSSDSDLDFKNMPAKDLTEEFIKYKQNKKDSVDNKTVVSEDSSNVETKIVPEKTKKNFLQKLFGPKDKKVEKDTVSQGPEIATEKIVVSEPAKTDTLNTENNIQQKDTVIEKTDISEPVKTDTASMENNIQARDTVVEKTNVPEPVKADVLKTDNDIKQKETIVKKDTVSEDESMGFSRPTKINIPKDNFQGDEGVVFGDSDSEDEPKSGLKNIKRKLPGSDREDSNYRINNEVGLRSESLTVKKEKVMGDSIGPADDEPIKNKKDDIKKNHEKKIFKRNLNPQDFAAKIKEGKVKGVSFTEKEIKLDRDTAKVVNQVLDSLKTVGVFEKVLTPEDSRIFASEANVAPDTVKTPETKTEAGYIMEKTEKRAEPLPGQIRAVLTLKKVEGGYLVQNSNGTYSTVIIDEKLMPELTGFSGQNEIVYVKNSDGSWYKLMLEVGK